MEEPFGGKQFSLTHDLSSEEGSEVFENLDEGSTRILGATSKNIVVNEKQRLHLLKEAEALKRLRKLEAAKSVALNNALTEHLSGKGVEFHPETNESSAQRYNASLKSFFTLDKKKKILEEMMFLEKLDVLTVKNGAEEDNDRLKKELSEKLCGKGNSDVNSHISKKSVSKIVKQFVKIHEEMSSVRYEFIIAQNLFAELKEKEDKFDDLGDGFRVLDFENLKTEAQTFSSNIDLKHEQLDKLRQRYNNESLKLNELQEKHAQVLDGIEREKARNEALLIDEKSLRLKLNPLKLSKNKLRHQLNELSDKTGILTQVPLMRNYEAVTDEMLQVSKEISDHKALIEKLKAVEMKVKKPETCKTIVDEPSSDSGKWKLKKI